MKIGELAKATQCQVETIRYYERKGLLPETNRTERNYRVYGPGDVDRLSFIRHCRRLDMTLGEISVLLQLKDAPPEDCSSINNLVDDHIKHVAVRIQELKSLHKQLINLRNSCAGSGSVNECGVLSGLSRALVEESNRSILNDRLVQGTHQVSGRHKAA